MGEEDTSADTASSQVSQSRESSKGSKVCGVCGDQALGYNFNAVTCESCKAFFRRNALRNKEFRCPFKDACEITAVTRRFCQKCRLRKCFAIGMRKDWILSEEDKRLKREKVENNKAAGRKRSRTGSTNSLDKVASSPAPPIVSTSTPETANENSQSQLMPSVSPGPQTTPTQQVKPQAWVTGTPKVKLPKLDVTEEALPSLPRSSPVSVITSPSSIITQPSAIQPNLILAQVLQTNQDVSTSSVVANSASYPSHVSPPQNQGLIAEPSFVPYSATPGPPQSSVSPGANASLPRDNPLLNSLIVNQNSEDRSNAYYSASESPPPSSTKSKNQSERTNRSEVDASGLPNLVSVKVEEGYSSQSSPTWWQGSTMPGAVVEGPMRPVDMASRSPNDQDIDKGARKSELVQDDASSFSGMEKLADATVSQLAPITLEDDWDYHSSLSRRVPIAPDSIGSILSEAIKIEFEALGPLHCSIRGTRDGGCSGSGSLQKHLNEVERAKLDELIIANQALLAPLDADLSAPLDTSVCGGGEPVLLDIINLTAVAIRRLIKMSKRIGAFKSLCQEDQVALLKGGCTEMMILRSVMTYDPDKDSWKIPHSGTSRSRGSPNLIKVDVLKKAPGNIYEEHQRFLRTFDARWRSDESVMLLLSAITLFSPQRPHVVHADVVRLEQNSYYYLLRRYLENACPNGCEARSTFLHLIQKMAELHRLNEEHVRVYLDVNPRDVEPLLIEIFDLKPH